MPSGTRTPPARRRALWCSEATLTLPDQRRIQALLDRRPDREGRREVVALDDEVGAVAHTDLLDLREQLLGRVPGEHVREARLHANPHEREHTGLLPLLAAGKLHVAEHHPRQLIWTRGMRMRKRHRHVQIGGRASKAASKIGSLKRGSQAFSTASGCSFADQRNEIGLRSDASTRSARSDRVLAEPIGYHLGGSWCETSASTTAVNSGLLWAIDANAAPTPAGPDARALAYDQCDATDPTRAGPIARSGLRILARRRYSGFGTRISRRRRSAHVCCPTNGDCAPSTGPRLLQPSAHRALGALPTTGARELLWVDPCRRSPSRCSRPGRWCCT